MYYNQKTTIQKIISITAVKRSIITSSNKGTEVFPLATRALSENVKTLRVLVNIC